MNSYAIFTDTGCDLSPEVLGQWDVTCVNLTFHFEGDNREYTNEEMPIKDFYQRMRNGSVSKTAAPNIDDFYAAFEPTLQQGRDILYVGFSSGLSNTSNAGKLAAGELLDKYPDRKIFALDTLCASAGLALMVHFAVQARSAGMSIQENAAMLQEKAPSMCHWFTVDDLVYLKRGGRVSSTSALVGSLLNIKPVLHVDDEGHLINMLKVRGRKQSIQALARKYADLALDPQNGPYFISHGDCLQDAQLLESMIEKNHGIKAGLITNIGPVIGSHSGPGTLALFFLGSQR